MGRAIGRLAATAVAGAIAFALPPRCPGCGTIVEGDDRFCGACWRALDWLSAPLCAQCGAPLDHAGTTTCEPCAGRPSTYRARAAVRYGGVARAVVLRLKHGGRPAVARTLAAAMARLVADAPDDAIVAAVPLHRWRLWRRGYNQSLLIARRLARARGIACIPDLLLRTRATPVLGGLGPAARTRAVAGAFAVPARHRPALSGRSVVLVDDVLTTGATAEACAAALRAAGAGEVLLVTWARVIREDPDR